MVTVRWILYIAVQCAAIRFTHADEKALGCDEGWTLALGNCYYIDNTRLVTWPEGVAECNRHDGDMIYFESQDELNWYMGIANNYTSTAYWTNLNDLVSNNPAIPGDGTWKWGLYDIADPTLINWSHSPGNDGKSLCGGINEQGKMYDADCSSKQGYICNIDNGATEGAACPFGWIPTDTDCYYVSNTSDPSQMMTWAQAKARCVALSSSAHLITIDDVNDQTFVQGQLPYLSNTAILHWTGLQGNGQAGGWKWFNQATFSQSLFTWASEPDNVGGKESCGVIRYNGKFSDRGCNVKQNYICKKPQIYTDTSFNLGCGLWTRANQKCYIFKHTPKSTWQQAKQYCQSQRGDLLNVLDIDIKSWILEQMMNPIYDDIFYWIALNDIQTEGVYKWGDGSIADNNVVSWDNEPNDFKGQEDCGLIIPSAEFNDQNCGFQAPPLCELDSVQNCPTTDMHKGTWVSMPSDTGNGLNCYFFGNTSIMMSWQEAGDLCRSLAIQITVPPGLPKTLIPKLYSVDTVTERDFIKKQMLNYLNNPYGFWTSLTDAKSEGFWVFSNNIQADTSLVEWHTEPSSLSPDMDCVVIGDGAVFNTKKCSLKTGYICERAAYLPWTSGVGKAGRSGFTSLAVLFLPAILRLFH